MRWFVIVTLAISFGAACGSTDPGPLADAAKEAAIAYADESFGLATGGM